MQIAFGRVRRKIALLRTCPFVVGQFIAHQLPIYFLKLHETAPAGPGVDAGGDTIPEEIRRNTLSNTPSNPQKSAETPKQKPCGGGLWFKCDVCNVTCDVQNPRVTRNVT